jgi:hypothetical protein
MRSVPSTPIRRAASILLALAALAACGGPKEIRTVADFDAVPCLLFPDARMTQVVSEPYRNLVGSDPKPSGEPAASGTDGNHACTWTFVPSKPPSQVPPITTLTVTLEHNRQGSQPLAICVAGAAQKAPGYKLQHVGDQSCLSPTTHLWMKHGDNFYHVVLVPQPGFPNPVDMNLALSPMILAVASAAASNLPKS